MIIVLFFITSFIGALVFYKRQRPQWKTALLFDGEEIMYQQARTTINTIGSDGVRRGMALGYIRVTNNRIFFLYPDKKAISKVLDFSRGKHAVVDEKLHLNTLYLDRVGMSFETDVQGRQKFVAKAVDRNGHALKYEFFVQDAETLKKALGI